jgi:hypothetical protein
VTAAITSNGAHVLMAFFDYAKHVAGWLGKLRVFASDRSPNLKAAVALTLAAVLWRAAIALRPYPYFLHIVSGVALLLAYIAALLLVLGGVGWLAIRLIRLVVQWRVQGEVRERMTGTQPPPVNPKPKELRHDRGGNLTLWSGSESIDQFEVGALDRLR